MQDALYIKRNIIEMVTADLKSYRKWYIDYVMQEEPKFYVLSHKQCHVNVLGGTFQVVDTFLGRSAFCGVSILKVVFFLNIKWNKLIMVIYNWLQ